MKARDAVSNPQPDLTHVPMGLASMGERCSEGEVKAPVAGVSSVGLCELPGGTGTCRQDQAGCMVRRSRHCASELLMGRVSWCGIWSALHGFAELCCWQWHAPSLLVLYAQQGVNLP